VSRFTSDGSDVVFERASFTSHGTPAEKRAAVRLIEAAGCTWGWTNDRNWRRIEILAPDGMRFMPAGSVSLLCDDWRDAADRMTDGNDLEPDPEAT
jgi:hypothetical protein